MRTPQARHGVGPGFVSFCVVGAAAKIHVLLCVSEGQLAGDSEQLRRARRRMAVIGLGTAGASFCIP